MKERRRKGKRPGKEESHRRESKKASDWKVADAGKLTNSTSPIDGLAIAKAALDRAIADMTSPPKILLSVISLRRTCIALSPEWPASFCSCAQSTAP